MWLVKLLAIAAVAYVLILALIYFAQSAILFPTRMAAGGVALPPTALHLVFEGSAGARLHGVHIQPLRASGTRLVILGFGGNGWNAANTAHYLHEIFPAADVVAFHYRGYAPSSGRPSAAALLADAPLIHDHVASRLGSNRIVAVGFSIGAGVAAHLASRRDLAGLLLVTPFDSLEAVASAHYRWLPVSLLLRHRMNPIEDLRGSSVPVAIIAAGQDRIIPPKHARALARAVPNLVYEKTIAGMGHNDIYQSPVFRAAMREAFAGIAP